jgi:hypothetical protein
MGSNEAHAANGIDAVAVARNDLRHLQDRKDALEAEVQAITSRLNSGPSPPGTKGSLVDKEVS